MLNRRPLRHNVVVVVTAAAASVAITAAAAAITIIISTSARSLNLSTTMFANVSVYICLCTLSSIVDSSRTKSCEDCVIV